jgi:cytochrome c-type biogenesis protein CcmH
MHLLLIVLLLVLAGGATAQPAASAPALVAAPVPSALDQQVLRIAAELRCLVCQNQTIADSNAELALDLRRQVREQLQQGRSEAQVLEYMTTRYGDFVLYRPPVKGTTWLLWFGPAVLLVGAVLTLVLVLRRRARLPAEAFEPDQNDERDAPAR